VDRVIGLFLTVSPWLFGFADEPAKAWMPHLVVGLAIVVEALVTEPRGERAITDRGM
jgi:hypothetical protein